MKIITYKNVFLKWTEMKGPGVSRAADHIGFKRFLEAENASREPTTNDSNHHLIAPFWNTNADETCYVLETFLKAERDFKLCCFRN